MNYISKHTTYLSALLFVCLFAGLPLAKGQNYNFNYTENCRLAYQNFIALHTSEGHNYIDAELKTNPKNLMAVYIADYEDCIELLINCDNKEYEQRKKNFDTRLNLLDKGDKSSPWYLFCKAGIYVHWAIVNVRFGEQYKAALNFHKSFSLLEENEQRYPYFEYNHVFTGLEQAVIGSLPGSYKWIAAMFGMRGDVKKGTAQLSTFISTHTSAQPVYTETVLYYLFARFYLLSEQKEVWDFLNSARFSTADNLLNTFAKVNIALDYRKSDTALLTLKTASADPNYSRYPIFDYQQGVAMLTQLDTNATWYFYHYLKTTKSDIYIKDSWEKMAFDWFVNNNQPKASYCMAQVLTKGTARLDADKQAYRLAESKVWPLRELLQVRLLIDGGYNDRALKILQTIAPASLLHPADKAEYYFRFGRIYQELSISPGGGNYFNEAILNYHNCISAGKDRHEQFAARAALQMGKMYEHIGNNSEAIKKYNECLNMPSHDFQNSIDQQAKAGINRVEGK